MGIYGLPLDTTPNLTKLVKSNNLFVFNDIISPASLTDVVLTTALSMSNYENASTPWFMQFNIVDLLKATGYNTTWISNQGFSWRSHAVAIAANSANTTAFSKTQRYDEQGYDEVIIPILDSIKENNMESKQAYIIHLMGVHWIYKNRYPEEFSKFSIDDVDSIKQSYTPTPREKEIKKDYLNAIYYNDYIVSSIIDRFKDENAIVFYLSDHGEELYETRGVAGHAGRTSFQFEIPLIIYASDKFIESNPNTINRIKQALNKPQMSDDFIHSFFDILDLKVEGLDKTRSIFSDEYNASRKRMVYGIDYDVELKR